jgi:hypothetical protein
MEKAMFTKFLGKYSSLQQAIELAKASTLKNMGQDTSMS